MKPSTRWRLAPLRRVAVALCWVAVALVVVALIARSFFDASVDTVAARALAPLSLLPVPAIPRPRLPRAAFVQPRVVVPARVVELWPETVIALDEIVVAKKMRKSLGKMPRLDRPVPAIAAAPARAPAADKVDKRVERAERSERIVLGLVINGGARPDVTVVLRGGELHIDRAELERLGLGPAAAPVVKELSDLLPLASLAPRVRYRFDRDSLVLYLDVAPELLGRSRIDMAPKAPDGLVYTQDTSGFLNYGLHGDSQGGITLFGELGVRVSAALFTTTVAGGNNRDFVRGLSQVVFDDRDRLVRWTVGDAFAASGNLGGGVFLAGVTVARELSLDPYFVQTPGLSFEGATAAPGTLEVWVDGALERRVAVPAGTFELADLPAPTRGGEARYVLRDALGGSQTFVRPFGVSAGVLRPGLHQYSYSLGVERRAYATRSFDYGEPVAVGRHRVGVATHLTLGWRAEVAPMRGLASGGGEGTWVLGSSRVDFGVHASASSVGPGAAAYLAWAMPGRTLDASAYAIVRTPEYETISGDPASDRNLIEAGARLGVGAGDWRVNIEGRAAHSRDLGDTLHGRATIGVGITPGLDLRVGAGVGQGLGGTSLDLLATLTFVPGRRFSSTISQRVGPDGSDLTIATNTPMRAATDAGMHSTLVLGDDVRLLLRPEAQTSFGRYQASFSYDPQGLLVTADASGSIAFVSGAGFALMRPINGAFAFIEVPDGVEVRALRDNREVGRSDSGLIVVPDLVPYQANRLALAADQLGLEHSIGRHEVLIAPPHRGGVRVAFEVTKTRFVRGRVVLIDALDGLAPGPRTRGPEAVGRQAKAPGGSSFEGEVVPAYGSLLVTTKSEAQVKSPLGRRAEFELDGLGVGRHRATVIFHGRRCSFWLVVEDGDEPIEDVGLVGCRMVDGGAP